LPEKAYPPAVIRGRNAFKSWITSEHSLRFKYSATTSQEWRLYAHVDRVRVACATSRLPCLEKAQAYWFPRRYEVFKLVTAILALKNQKSLHLEIYVDRNRFEEFFFEMTRIVDSLAANPDFQL